MALGYRMEAIGVLGQNVMKPRGLVGLGYDSLDNCGPEIAEALRAYTVPSNYGILMHCTQGKDRTGLIITLILLLLDIPVAAISNDYLRSEAELLPEKEERLKEIRSIGLSDEFVGCPPEWCEKMEEHLREKYGGVKAYCESIGFKEEEQAELVRILCV